MKALWAPGDPVNSDLGRRKNEAKNIIVTPGNAALLAQLIGRSKRYPILINEGVVALSLMSTRPTDGGKCLQLGPPQY